VQLLALVGDQFGDDGAHITGAVIACRQKADKLALWTTTASDEAACMRIGSVPSIHGLARQARTLTNIGVSVSSRAFKESARVTGVMSYQVHADAGTGLNFSEKNHLELTDA
jgi:hypothetical protein